MTNKIINGIDVSECKWLVHFGLNSFKKVDCMRKERGKINQCRINNKKGLVIFKFGQSKARYFQIVSLKKQAVIDNLVKKLKVIEEKDIDRILTSIDEVLNERN